MYAFERLIQCIGDHAFRVYFIQRITDSTESNMSKNIHFAVAIHFTGSVR
jgi:hypothetical protein